jgi:DNA-binding IclR family transcriptional regulator
MKPATTIDKVYRVLTAFSIRPSLGVTEVAEITHLLKSDVHRILKSLEPYGFIEQDVQTRRYRLGLELLKLGHLVHGRLYLNEIARPFLRHLSEMAEAAASLAVYDPVDQEMVFVEQIDSPTEVQIRWRIGRRAAAHATALGKTLLAYLDSAHARSVIQRCGLPKRTQYTITDEAELERELARIREAGYAVDREEAVLGACCVAAPVRDHSCRVVAAISVSMVANRLEYLREREVSTLVRSTAGRIASMLGYPGDMPAHAGKGKATRIPVQGPE